MTVQFNRDSPIYSQLVNLICGQIVRRELKPGDKLPSVREYAVEVGVNVNTVQRVYKELELLQLTITKRGQGTFITTDNAVLLDLRERIKQQIVAQFLQRVTDYGMSYEEIMNEIVKNRGEEHD